MQKAIMDRLKPQAEESKAEEKAVLKDRRSTTEQIVSLSPVWKVPSTSAE